VTILLFSPFSISTTGGAEKAARNLAITLGKRGHQVHFLCRGDHQPQKTLSEGVSSWQLPLGHLHTWHKIPRPDSVARIAQSALRIHRLLQRIQPDIVNCHFANFYSLYFLLLRPFHSYRLVISTHGSDVLVPLSTVHRLLLPYLLRGACYVTAVSRPLLEAACEIASIRGHASIIHNGIDYEFWSQDSSIATQTESSSEAPGNAKGQAPIIVNVGSLRRVKGQDILIEAFARLSESLPSAQLRLVGDGDRGHDLALQAEDLGVRDRVTFYGWCNRLKVRQILNASTVFAFPSRSEGFGLALLEAMATGLPVVASRVGGIPDLVDSGRQGILVPPEDSALLSSSLTDAITDAERREQMSQEATFRAKKFSWQRTVDEYENLYASLI